MLSLSLSLSLPCLLLLLPSPLLLPHALPPLHPHVEEVAHRRAYVIGRNQLPGCLLLELPGLAGLGLVQLVIVIEHTTMLACVTHPHIGGEVRVGGGLVPHVRAQRHQLLVGRIGNVRVIVDAKEPVAAVSDHQHLLDVPVGAVPQHLTVGTRHLHKKEALERKLQVHVVPQVVADGHHGIVDRAELGRRRVLEKETRQ